MKKIEFNKKLILKVIIAVIVGSILLFFGSCSYIFMSGIGTAVEETVEEYESETITAEDKEKESLQMENVTFDESWSGGTVTGTIKNIYDKDLESISVKVTTYNEQGIKIQDFYDYCSGLTSGETWKFKVEIYEKDYDDYKLIIDNFY